MEHLAALDDRWDRSCSPLPGSMILLAFMMIGIFACLIALAIAIVTLIERFTSRGYHMPALNFFQTLWQRKEARREEKLRNEEEARAKAVSLSGLAEEMGTMGRARSIKDTVDCEAL